MKTSKRDEEFPEDISSLPIAKKAMRAIQEFLDAECGGSATLSPKETAKLRSLILEDVRFVAKKHADYHGKASTMGLAIYLNSMADNQRMEQGAKGSDCRPELLESLAEMFSLIASPPKKRKIKSA